MTHDWNWRLCDFNCRPSGRQRPVYVVLYMRPVLLKVHALMSSDSLCGFLVAAIADRHLREFRGQDHRSRRKQEDRLCFCEEHVIRGLISDVQTAQLNGPVCISVLLLPRLWVKGVGF